MDILYTLKQGQSQEEKMKILQNLPEYYNIDLGMNANGFEKLHGIDEMGEKQVLTLCRTAE